MKKTINGRVNKVNTSNLSLIIRELFKDNIVRGRGLLARGLIQAQSASPFYTAVYAALVSVINTKFPQIGELIVKRLISSFRRTYQRNDKPNCLSTTRFIAHLVNQNVVCIVFILIETDAFLIFLVFIFSYMKLLHYKYSFSYWKILRMIV